MKHKAVSEVSGAAIKAVESKVLLWFAKKLYAAAPPLTAALAPAQCHNEITYGGIFQGYHQLCQPTARTLLHPRT